MSDSPQRVADGIYKLRGHFYHRPYTPAGTRTWRALKGRTLKAAKADHARVTGDLDTSITIAEAIQAYLAAGCPDKRRNARPEGKQLDGEKARCATLFKYWRATECSRITSAMLDDFADWRMKNRKRGNHGGRAADLDIVTLRNVFQWVTRKGLLRVNPFTSITVSTYRKAQIRHCRQVAPKSGEELHDLAAQLFTEGRSAILGWLTLITAMVGFRITEMTALRTDAKEGDPGNITDGVLWLTRKKKGANNFFRIHPDLQTCLDHFFAWRKQQKRFRRSPWWFPGDRDSTTPVSDCALSHALRRIGKRLVGEVRTAHGLRSFYVTCRRSQGASDPQIALETGQISGGREITRTYGDATPKKVHWMPTEGKPAWTMIDQFQTTTKRIKPDLKTVVKVKFTDRRGTQSPKLALPVMA